MSTHRIGRHGRADPVGPEGHRDVELDGAGAYLTDGVFLYRVVRHVPSAAGELVALEDCYALDVVRVPLVELRERGIRVVTRAAVDTRDSQRGDRCGRRG